MNKILIAFDGENFSEGAFNFVSKMREHKPFLLTAAFLSSVDYTVLFGYPVGFMNEFMMEMIEKDEETTAKNIARFKTLCEKNDIEYRIHNDIGDSALEELKKETRFADLLILGSELFYKNTANKALNESLSNILHNTECPILLIPEQCDSPSNIVLTYDGSESSVYAIKQFSYLFPEWHNRATTLVYSNDEKEEIPYRLYIEELVARHYNNLNLLKLDVDPQDYFNVWVSGKEKPIVVAGGYGRSGVSEIFRKNFLSDILRDHKVPVFIAHK